MPDLKSVFPLSFPATNLFREFSRAIRSVHLPWYFRCAVFTPLEESLIAVVRRILIPVETPSSSRDLIHSDRNNISIFDLIGPARQVNDGGANLPIIV